MKKIAIVGGGASGVLAAIALAQRSGEQEISLFEPASALAEGVAYSTIDPQHRLNVPAKNMSALVDQPSDLVDWANVTGDEFISRSQYAAYLRATLESQVRKSKPTFEHIRASVIDAEFKFGRWNLYTGDAVFIDFDAVILATGWGLRVVNRSKTRMVTAWSHPAITWTEYDDVGIVGNGLTAIDYALTVLTANPRATVTMYSRHGLAPQSHASSSRSFSPPDSFATAPDLIEITRFIRGAGSDWRAAVDSLRPITSQIWQNLSPQTRQQFWNRLVRYWDVVRHRMSPEVENRIQQYRQADRIHSVKASVLEIAEIEHAAQLKTSLGQKTHDLVVMATGAKFDFSSNPLLHSLGVAGQVAEDFLGIKSEPTTGQLISATGRPVPGLYAIGPLRRAALFESTAVPEIRVQAAELATLLLDL